MIKTGTVRTILTNYDENVFWEEQVSSIEPVGCMKVVNIYPECTRQVMRGFGGAFTEAAGVNYSKLSDEVKKEFVDSYFSEEGLCYNMGRTHINSCDFSLSNYACDDDPDDTEFKNFSMDRAQQYLIPLIKAAEGVRGEKLEILLSPWSPPAYMKTNGDMNNGGSLRREYYDAWAHYIAYYIGKLNEQDLNIRYLSIQNEPAACQTWDSCEYTAEEEMVFVRDFLGPVLEKEGLDSVKILVWDHNKEIAYERAEEILADRKAADYIAGIAVHWYTGDHFEALGLIRERHPDKEIFFTEGCVEYSRFMDSGEIYKAEMYAHDMMGNFNNGVSAFLDWNLLLDSEGGPNHAKNFCAAPIMCTGDFGSIEKRLTYYYIGHFSRYVKPGAKAAAVTRFSDCVDAAAFVNPDQERVIILMNRTDHDQEIALREYGYGSNIQLKSHAIMTVCYTIC